MTMLRFLFRLIVLALLLAGAAVAYATYPWGSAAARFGGEVAAEVGRGVASGAAGVIDRERVRETGAEIAETVAKGAERADAALAEARLTAKITSKMVLDDTIEASRLNVDTHGTVVTVRGAVDTDAQRARALQLARETDSVTQVIDEIEIVGR
jgi:osmotically-inducible protein OsmY